MNCKDKVAIVTGAAGKGMGRSIALTLAREGAKVIVNYRRSRESAAAIVEHVAARSGQAVAAEADVFTADGCQSLVKSACGRFGQVDICLLGPGAGWHPETPDKLSASAALEDAQAELAPIYHLLPLVLPGMYERKWGRIIGISLLPPFDSPAYAYNVAEAARTRALLQMRGAAWKHGVTVNVIAPGPVGEIETLAQAAQQCDHGPAWASRSATSPQDIAEGVAFLCSEAGAFVSGCELTYLYR